MRHTGGRWLLVAAKVAVSASLIAYLLRSVDLDELGTRAQDLAPSAAVATVLMLAAYTSITGIRWLIVLHALGCRLTYGAAIRISFIGSFFNQILPTTVGADAIRIWESYRTGIGLAKSVRSVIFERGSYFFVVGLAAGIGATAWSERSLPAELIASLWLLALIMGLL